MRRLLVLAAVVTLIATALPASAVVPAAASSATQSDTVTHIGQYKFTGATEIAWEGDWLYVGQFNGEFDRGSIAQGGVYIFDISKDKPVLAGQLECHGYDNDVNVVRPGIIAVAHHITNTCPAADHSPVRPIRGNGIYLADVSNPTRPIIVGAVAVPSAHTLTPHPTKPYVFVSGGGLANGPTSVVDVSDPSNPRVVEIFSHNVLDCHDLQFKIEEDRDLVFCAGLGEIRVFDVTNPEDPRSIGAIVNPGIQFPHNALVSPDGELLVINDEAFGFHECESESSAYGSLWIYDITVSEAPVLAGRVAPPESRPTVGNYAGWVESWCAAHNYNFVPGTRILTSAWFAGGITVEDLSDPLNPERLARYDPGDGIAYTSHWHDGRIFVADMSRGLETLKVDGIAEDQQGPVADSRARGDLTDLLVPAGLPALSGSRPERSMDNSAFCVIPKPVAASAPALNR